MPDTKKVAMLFAHGFEEIEAVTVVDVLRRGGVEVDIIGVEGKGLAKGAHSINVEVDMPLSDAQASNYDGIVLPGGLPGSHTLRDNNDAQVFIKAFNGKLQAAICAAPVALLSAGALEGKNVTSHPSKESDFSKEYYKKDRVVVDGNIITSRGAGTAFEFTAAILEYYSLGKKAKDLQEAMIYS